MKKVLLVTGAWGNGGIENLISLYCKNIANEDIRMDVFSFSSQESVYTKRIIDSGGKLLTPDFKISGNIFIKNFKSTKSFINVAKNYDIVHYNTAFALAYIHCAILKLFNHNIKIIIHSHGDSLNPPHVSVKMIFHYITKNILYSVIDYGLACSKNSGDWLFNHKVVSSSRFQILKNATNLSSFKFSYNARTLYRNKLCSIDKLIIGTIGRIEYQKNPYFTVRIIKELNKTNIDFQFIWIGSGSDANDIKDLIKREGLTDRVIFIDHTEEICEYLSAMDIFILPSRYEGLGIVLLEAQVNGLFCLTSNTTPPEARITNKIKYLPIENDCEKYWVNQIMDYNDNNDTIRPYPEEELEKSGYDLIKVCRNLKSIYDSL